MNRDCDWVVIQRLMAEQPVGGRAPSRAEKMQVALQVHYRGGTTDELARLCHVSGKYARVLMAEAINGKKRTAV